tara:strand:+ start:270 stop:3719 length:3450 start_codon:yes stop_codon:yes gene_type:complete
MVGKTPQVREIVYNVLDDNGDRTIVAKGASTVDVGDTEQLFTRTSNLEVVSSNTFSNVSNLQSNVVALEIFLSSVSFPGGQGVYQPILSVLEQNQVSNAARIDTLITDLEANAVIVDGTYSNVSTLQTDTESNAVRLTNLESYHLSNVANINGNFSNISILSNDLSDNVLRIEALEADIGLVTNFGDITGLQSNVTELRNRVASQTIRIGTLSGGSSNGGPGTSANSAIAIGDNAGAHMGNRSIAIGGFAGFNTQPIQASQTERSIVISAQPDPLRATRTDTLVISPMIEDNSNTIQMMGYNLTSNELVNTSLLKLLSDSNIHSTTNVYIGNGSTKIDTDGNGSFGGNIDIHATLDVGSASSFGGAMTLNNNLETIGTSSFGGKMEVNNDIDCNGQSFIMKNGNLDKIIFRDDGTGSFFNKVEVNASGNNTTANPAFEVAGASTFKSDVKIGDAGADNLEVVGTSSFGGDMTMNNDLAMTNGSFTMNDGSDKIKLQTNGNSSFAGQMTSGGIDVTSGTVDIYHNAAELRVGPGINDLKAKINQDGQGSFTNIIAWDATKTTLATPALKVEGRTLLNNGLSVSATAASSFAGTCSFVSTTSFGGDMKMNNDLAMTNGSFTMNNGSDRIKLQTNGDSSFAGQMTSGAIDVTSGTVDIIHGTGALRVGPSINDLKAKINQDGTSSFLGVMEVNDNIVCDGVLAVRSGGIDRIMLTPNNTSDSQLKVLGDIQTYNGTTPKTEIDSGGNGSFSATVTAAAFSGGGVSTSNSANKVVKRDASGNFSAGTITGAMSTSLTPGTHLDGSAYNGSTARTFSVIAETGGTTWAQSANKIVQRDYNGDIKGYRFHGGGEYLTNLDGSKVTSGTIDKDRVAGTLNHTHFSHATEVFGASYETRSIQNDYQSSGGFVREVFTQWDGDSDRYASVGVVGNVLCFEIYLRSDKRNKKNIKTIDTTTALDLVDKINTVSYLEKSTNRKKMGVIAQELEEILPHAVSANNDTVCDIMIPCTFISKEPFDRPTVSINKFKLSKPLSSDIELVSIMSIVQMEKSVVDDNGRVCKNLDTFMYFKHDEENIYLLSIIDEAKFDLNDGDVCMLMGRIVGDSLSVDYNSVFSLSLPAIKELNIQRVKDKKRIDDLEDTVANLLERINSLEGS